MPPAPPGACAPTDWPAPFPRTTARSQSTCVPCAPALVLPPSPRLPGEDKSQEWSVNFLPLFTFSTIEDFWAGFSRVPRASDVLAKKGQPRVRVERPDPAGAASDTAVQGYMLCRKGALPDYKQELTVKGVGRRVYLSGYVSRTSAPLGEDAASLLWEAVLLAVVGEVCDPAEVVLAAYLQHGGKGKDGVEVELWFGVRDDGVCEAVCEALREEVQASADKRGGAKLGSFSKNAYFEKKHKYEKGGEYAGTPLGGLFLGLPDEPPPASSAGEEAGGGEGAARRGERSAGGRAGGGRR